MEWRATAEASRVIRERNITKLPVDPVALARGIGIEVMAKPASARGVSGMLIRHGNEFGIAYATHIDNLGFQNFSVAHELGHYYMPGHIDAVLRDGDVHESHAGFSSDDPFELEADHFAAALLMPDALFGGAIRTAGAGLTAVEVLSEVCMTSLTATAIRYARRTDDAVAIVISSGKFVHYCFMSDPLLEIAGSNRINKKDRLPPGTETCEFNKDEDRVKRGARAEGACDLQDWIGGRQSVELREEVVGLGNWGRTLTVLTADDLPDLDAEREDEDIVQSSKPRFRR
jgi:hypothetical protein